MYKDEDKLIARSTLSTINIEPPAGSQIIIVKGQTEPMLPGWISYGNKEFSASYAVGVKIKAKQDTLETKFTIH